MMTFQVSNEQNMTQISTVHLLGFQTGRIISCLMFIFLLLVYCAILCGNLMIIALVVYSKTLHSPMYFFLCQLCVPDIILATDILPNTLHTLLEETIMSFSVCLNQFYVFAFTEAVEYFLLTVMSYDRYLAICKPLHYTSIMNQKLCWVMVSICWVLGIVMIINDIIAISTLQFCGPNVIDHIFCDLDPILHLSCSDPTIVKLEITFLAAFVLAIPFSFIMLSYIFIIFTIFKISSVTGRQKVFSTCSSHLSVVCTSFGTLVCVYIVPNKGQSMNISKFLSLLYTAGTPLMNPIIYSLRNEELKKIIKNKLISRDYKKNI